MRESEFDVEIAYLLEKKSMDEFKSLFTHTKRLQSIPEIIEKRLGLKTGKKLSYDEVAATTIAITSGWYYKDKKLYPVTRETIRRNYIKGLLLIRRALQQTNNSVSLDEDRITLYDFPTRIYHALYTDSITKFSELINLTEAQVLRIPNISKHSLIKIKNILKAKGMEMKE